jgi:hypothetical protein
VHFLCIQTSPKSKQLVSAARCKKAASSACIDTSAGEFIAQKQTTRILSRREKEWEKGFGQFEQKIRYSTFDYLCGRGAKKEQKGAKERERKRPCGHTPIPKR